MEIVVSICCITFNHEDYIGDTLKGFLMQETSFPFEIIIHDDASTDRTAEIIKEFASQDSRIKPILQTENQWSKGIKPSPTFVWPRAKGKYLALCEGDDFWTDPNKLQKQVTFLESNLEYVGCFHNVTVINTYNKKESLFYGENKKSRPFGINRIICKNPIPTLSVIFRKNTFKVPEDYNNYVVGDWPIHILNAQHGDYYYMNENMGAYRIHSGGVHQGGVDWNNQKKKNYLIKLLFLLKSLRRNLSKPNVVLYFRILFDEFRLLYYRLLTIKP